MTFSDFVLDKRLEKYETIPKLNPDEINELKNKTHSLFSDYLSKEKISEHKHQHKHVGVKQVDHVNQRHFYHEFPRLQSNNDMSYHEEDITMRFIYDYFFSSDKKK